MASSPKIIALVICIADKNKTTPIKSTMPQMIKRRLKKSFYGQSDDPFPILATSHRLSYPYHSFVCRAMHGLPTACFLGPAAGPHGLSATCHSLAGADRHLLHQIARVANPEGGIASGSHLICGINLSNRCATSSSVNIFCTVRKRRMEPCFPGNRP